MAIKLIQRFENEENLFTRKTVINIDLFVFYQRGSIVKKKKKTLEFHLCYCFEFSNFILMIFENIFRQKNLKIRLP